MSNSKYVRDLRKFADNYEQSVGDEIQDETFGLSVQWTDSPKKHIADLCNKLTEAASVIEDFIQVEHELVTELEGLKYDKWEMQQEINDLKDEISALERQIR